MEDNYRYIGFTDTLVNIGEGFLAEDGIFKVLSLSYGFLFLSVQLWVSQVPVTGTYLFSAHALPARNKPFNVQLHRNRYIEKTTLDVTDVFFQPPGGKLV